MEDVGRKVLSTLRNIDIFLLYWVFEPLVHLLECKCQVTNYALARGTLYLSFASFCLLIVYRAGVLGTLPLDPKIFITILPLFVLNSVGMIWGIRVYFRDEKRHKQQLQFGQVNQRKQEWEWAAIRLGTLFIFLLVAAGYSYEFFVDYQPFIAILLFNLIILPLSIHFYFASCDPPMPEDHQA